MTITNILLTVVVLIIAGLAIFIILKTKRRTSRDNSCC